MKRRVQTNGTFGYFVPVIKKGSMMNNITVLIWKMNHLLQIILVNAKVPNRFWLGMAAFVLVLLSGCGVEGINFTFNGFNGSSDVYTVPNGGQWIYDPRDSSLYLKPSNVTAVAGRFLYPHLVQMVDPKTMVANSFSCNFIFQILMGGNGGTTHTGSGMTFMMVPDNFTIAGTVDYMGLLTANSSDSNLHTFGVEFDTHMNPEFNDPNDNHIGIDLRSMNSTANFTPTFRLANEGNFSDWAYYQVWINYSQAPDSRMDIYIGGYGQGKPSIPSVTTSVNLSFLNEYMYVGFSAAQSGSYVHKILAWSFSTDGPAPPISITLPAFGAPNPSPKSSRPGTMLRLIVGLFFGIMAGICVLMMLYCCWTKPPLFGPPVRLFLAHSGGDPDYAGKIFAERLYRELTSTWRYWLNLITVFFDRPSLPYGESFPENIERELEMAHVGVVIITEAFFQNKWPMTELVSFVRRRNRVRILPLFYRLQVSDVRSGLDEGTWDENWRAMNRLDVDECRDAVRILCDQRGVEYNARNRSHESEYIDEVLAKVARICDKIRHRRRE